MKKSFLISILLLLLCINSLSIKAVDISKMMEQMTVEEKIGQLIMVGINGTDQLTTTDSLLITNYHIGGVLYYPRNIKSLKQLKNLSSFLQELSLKDNKIPLWIATDHEGGSISYFNNVLSEVPGNMLTGAAGDPKNAYDIGMITGEELKYIGVNLNLAPVVDVNNNPENPIIGTRSFGENPDKVGKFGLAYMKGLEEKGVLAVAKHFPGHGDTAFDTHLYLPEIKHSLKHLEKIELKPFKNLINSNIKFIMTAHIVFPELDNKYPATLSHPILTGYLRNKLKFNGLIISDDLTMKAIANHYGIGEAAVKSVKAGTDILLAANDFAKQREIYNSLLEAVKSGELSQELLDKKVNRILQVKKEAGLWRKKKISTPNFTENEKIADKVTAQGITLIGNNNTIPLDKEKKTLVMSIKKIYPYYQDSQLYQTLKKNDFSITTLSFPVNNFDFNMEKLKEVLEDTDQVLITAYNLNKNQKQLDLIKEIISIVKSNKKKTVLLSLGSPYDINFLENVVTNIILYEPTEMTIKNAVKILAGRTKPAGNLPVSLD